LPAEDDVRAHVVAKGRVQGVFFRSDTRDRARSLGVRGWVSNRHDGTVEAIFEGPREQVETLIRWCRRGPAGAQVEDVEVTWEEPRGERDFVVR
jgi:acylphosphatase